MGKSTEKSASKVDAATVVVVPKTSSEKGKREAEDAIENEVLNAKKQKVEESTAKIETKVEMSVKDGNVGSLSDDRGSGLEDTSAAKKEPAVAEKKGDIAASKKKDELNDNTDSSSIEETSSNEDVAVTKKASETLTKEGPVAAAKKTDESSESSEPSSQDHTIFDEDIAAPNEAPTTTSAKKRVISMQKIDESSSLEFECADETCSDKIVATAEKVPVAPTNKGLVIATKKIDESSSDDESAGEDDVTTKNTSAAVIKKENVSNEEPRLNNEASSSDNDPKTSVTPKEQITGSKTLFVGNLSFSIEREDVEHFFKAAGEVVNIRFGMNSDETFRGFGYVEFASAEAAEKALHELNGKELLRRPVRLDFVKERRSYTPYSGKDTQSFQKGGRAQGPRISVHGFNKFDGEDQFVSSLDERFGSTGDITKISILKDQDGAVKGKDTQSFQKGGRAQGQSFVSGFNKLDGEDQPQIRSSLEEHFGSSGEITRIYIPKDQDGAVKGKDTQSFQRGGRAEGQRIFVRGFNKFDGEDQIRSSLEEHFCSCGEITRVSIPRDQDGAIKGIALIDFKDSDAFNQALKLDRSEFGGSTLSVEEARPRRDNGGRGRGRGWRGGGWDFGGRSGWRSGRWDFGRRSGSWHFGWRSGDLGGGCFGGGGRER